MAAFYFVIRIAGLTRFLNLATQIYLNPLSFNKKSRCRQAVDHPTVKKLGRLDAATATAAAIKSVLKAMLS